MILFLSLINFKWFYCITKLKEVNFNGMKYTVENIDSIYFVIESLSQIRPLTKCQQKN